MAQTSTQNSLLLLQFRRFYSEVLYLKLRLERSDLSSLAASPSASNALAVNEVWGGLLNLLEAQGIESARAGGAFTFEIYREAQYVMAALADEIFLNSDWPGRETWPLLEKKLFQSHASGEVFFRRVDRLLQERDKAYSDLAMIYFQALALGFRGKYRDHDERGELEQYRRRLFIQIYHRAPDDLAHDRNIFPQSYMPTLSEGEGRRLPNPRTWLIAFGGVCVLWLGVSDLLWRHLTVDIHSLIRSIQSTQSVQWSGRQ